MYTTCLVRKSTSRPGLLYVISLQAYNIMGVFWSLTFKNNPIHKYSLWFNYMYNLKYIIIIKILNKSTGLATTGDTMKIFTLYNSA